MGEPCPAAHPGGKVSCWEFMKCGRELGGLHSARLGICAACLDTASHGLNGGLMGGRMCWAVVGTLGGRKLSESLSGKRASCMACEFFKRVRQEEGLASFALFKPGPRAGRWSGAGPGAWTTHAVSGSAGEADAPPISGEWNPPGATLREA